MCDILKPNYETKNYVSLGYLLYFFYEIIFKNVSIQIGFKNR